MQQQVHCQSTTPPPINPDKPSKASCKLKVPYSMQEQDFVNPNHLYLIQVNHLKQVANFKVPYSMQQQVTVNPQHLLQLIQINHLKQIANSRFHIQCQDQDFVNPNHLYLIQVNHLKQVAKLQGSIFNAATGDCQSTTPPPINPDKPSKASCGASRFHIQCAGTGLCESKPPLFDPSKPSKASCGSSRFHIQCSNR